MITQRYLLVLDIPIVSDNGTYFADPLWHKDLMLHLEFIERLTLFCPAKREPAPGNWLPISDSRLAIIPIEPMTRTSFLRIPAILRKLVPAIGEAEIVHTGVAGWPFPLGWLAIPLARHKKKFVMIIVESSFWRAGPTASLRARHLARLREFLNRLCVNACDLSIFTTEEYRKTLATHPRGATAIMPASWIDDEFVLTAADADDIWQKKEVRFLFAGRLTPAKGLAVLLSALENTTAKVDIIGEGELEASCRQAAERHSDRVRVLSPVAYGKPFLSLIDKYMAVIVPSVSEEQPRVVFDAYARAVPVIASATSGHRDCVHDGKTGLLFKSSDPAALRQAMEWAMQHQGRMREMGGEAVRWLAGYTHQEMHRSREILISKSLEHAVVRTS